jgi:hypothetical protein
MDEEALGPLVNLSVRIQSNQHHLQPTGKVHGLSQMTVTYIWVCWQQFIWNWIGVIQTENASLKVLTNSYICPHHQFLYLTVTATLVGRIYTVWRNCLFAKLTHIKRQTHKTVLQPRRQPSSYSPPWEPQILIKMIVVFICTCVFF